MTNFSYQGGENWVQKFKNRLPFSLTQGLDLAKNEYEIKKTPWIRFPINGLIFPADFKRKNIGTAGPFFYTFIDSECLAGLLQSYYTCKELTIQFWTYF